MEQSRWKSPIFWSGVITAILSVLVAMNVINLEQQEALKNAVIAICGAWSIFASANNPTNATGF
jgi:hypothetical protein